MDATVSPPTQDDAYRLGIDLAPPPQNAPLAVVGRQWCFEQPMTLRTTHNQWLRTLTVKNVAAKTTLVRIKHMLSATMYINPMIEPISVYDVLDGATKAQILTVQREWDSTTYVVHNGVLHEDDGPQPGLFAVTPKGSATTTGTTTSSEVIAFRDATTGEAYEAIVDGDIATDRVAIVRIRKERTGGDAWYPVARIHRPKPKLLQAEYFTLEIAPGMDAMFVVMVWLPRWAEFVRQKPQLTSYQIWTSAPFDLTKKEHPDRPAKREAPPFELHYKE